MASVPRASPPYLILSHKTQEVSPVVQRRKVTSTASVAMKAVLFLPSPMPCTTRSHLVETIAAISQQVRRITTIMRKLTGFY